MRQRRAFRKDAATGWILALCALVAGIAATLGVSIAVVSTDLAGRATLPATASASLALEEEAPAWLTNAQGMARRAGHGWITLTLDQRVVLVGGQAPNPVAARRGFVAAAAAVTIQSAAREAVDVVVDDIVQADAASIASALRGLEPAPSVEACQAAFRAALEGRSVGFETRSARIEAASRPLLDVLAALSTRCGAHRIEIAAHTDTDGAEARNLIISQERADAVRDYLASKGAPIGQISAIGYGEEQPLEGPPSASRRVEFSVTPY